MLLSCWKEKAHYGKDRPGRRLYPESRVKGCGIWAVACTVNYDDSLNLMISGLYWFVLTKVDIFSGTRNIFFPQKLYSWGCVRHMFSLLLVSPQTWWRFDAEPYSPLSHYWWPVCFLGLAKRIWLSKWLGSHSQLGCSPASVRVEPSSAGLACPSSSWEGWVPGGFWYSSILVFHAVTHSSRLGRAGSPWCWTELGAGMGLCLRQLSPDEFIVAGTRGMAVLDQVSKTAPRCKRSVHQDCFLLGKSSCQVLPWTCHVLLSSSCLWASISGTAAQLVLFNFHFLDQYLHSPFSFPWCPAVQPGLDWGVEVSHRSGPSWMLCLHILPSIPALVDVLCRWAEGFSSQFFSIWLVKSINAAGISSLSSYRLVGWMFCSCLLAKLMLTALCVWGGGKDQQKQL